MQRSLRIQLTNFNSLDEIVFPQFSGWGWDREVSWSDPGNFEPSSISQVKDAKIPDLVRINGTSLEEMQSVKYQIRLEVITITLIWAYHCLKRSQHSL